MPPHFLDPTGIVIESVYTLAVVLFCFLIYHRTKNIYALTKYKGIKYFRMAFLFFGLSYIMRFFFGLISLSRVSFDFLLPGRLLMPFFILPLTYLSTMAVFYLIFSLIWKKLPGKKHLVWAHSLAAVLSLTTFLTRSHFVLVLIQAVLLILAIILSFVLKQKGHRISSARIIYIFIFVFWLVNLIILGPGMRLPFGLEVVFQAISLALFLVIFYKVSKWTK